jgi:hypothetical protein
VESGGDGGGAEEEGEELKRQASWPQHLRSFTVLLTRQSNQVLPAPVSETACG